MFAGPRDERFFVDLGGDVRPAGIRGLDGNSGSRIDSLTGFNVHTIALEIPIERLSRNGHGAVEPERPGGDHRRLVHGQPPVDDHARGGKREPQR